MASILNSAFQYDKEARIFESKFEDGKVEEQLNHDLNSFRSNESKRSDLKLEINEDNKIAKMKFSQFD